MKNTQSTLVILSGGMDSTVLAYRIAHSPIYDLAGCVSVNYGQRHSYELRCAAQTAADLEVPHYLLELGDLGRVLNSSALTGRGVAVPEGHYAEESMKATVVPNRNMILIALAVAVGITHKVKFVAYGAHAGDHAVYPDCRPDFADALGAAVRLCDYSPPHLIKPFIQLTKAEIVALGVSLKVPFQRTWTCYNGVAANTQPIACGRCGTCVERLEAFALADAKDSLLYADVNYWRTVSKLVPVVATQA